MARARTPVAKAAALGADVKNPGRHKGRSKSAAGGELGPPSKYLDLHAQRAFNLFRAELPWLKESHRVLVELAATYRGRMIDPDPDKIPLGLQAAQELRRCLAQLGATPADESKVNTGSGDDDDPEEKLFKGTAGRAPPPPPKPH